MKKYGCSNIDELVDELKKLRLENKELKDTIDDLDMEARAKDMDNAKLQDEIERLKKRLDERGIIF